MSKVNENKKNLIVICGIVVAIFICIVGVWLMCFSGDDVKTTSSDNSVTTESVKNDNSNNNTNSSNTKLDSSLTYYASIDIRDYGTITVELDQKSAPVTVENFVSLAESGFYNGLTFHRIIENFMMQGGDPNGNGTGGSSEKIVGEFMVNGYNNTLSHTRGAISMARSSNYNSASSQFFIVHQDSLYLDGQYAVFGYVTEGLDVVDAVCEAAMPIDNNGSISAEQQPVITSVTITTK